MEDLEFNIEHHKQTNKWYKEYYSLHVPHDIYDDAEELDEGRYRVLNIFKSELKQLHKIITDALEKK